MLKKCLIMAGCCFSLLTLAGCAMSPDGNIMVSSAPHAEIHYMNKTFQVKNDVFTGETFIEIAGVGKRMDTGLRNAGIIDQHEYNDEYIIVMGGQDGRNPNSNGEIYRVVSIKSHHLTAWNVFPHMTVRTPADFSFNEDGLRIDVEGTPPHTAFFRNGTFMSWDEYQNQKARSVRAEMHNREIQVRQARSEANARVSRNRHAFSDDTSIPSRASSSYDDHVSSAVKLD